MPEQTMQQAARELHEAVLAVQELVTREYPSRQEVERKFQSKQHGRAQAWLLVGVILVSVTFSYIMALSTVTTCFLDATSPAVCDAIPGYEEAVRRDSQLERIILDLDNQGKSNDRRLDRIEKELKIKE